MVVSQTGLGVCRSYDKIRDPVASRTPNRVADCPPGKEGKSFLQEQKAIQKLFNSMLFLCVSFFACSELQSHICPVYCLRTSSYISYMVKPHGQLVLVSSTPHNASTPSLSTS